MRSVAVFVSYLFHPFLILFLSPFLIVFKVSKNLGYSLKWESLSVFFLIILIAFVCIQVKRGKFSSFDVIKKEQRKSFYSFSAVLASFYFITVILFNGPIVLLLTIICMILAILLMALINRYKKASVHAASIAAFTVLMSILYGGIFSLSLIAIPLVGWARIKLGRHSWSEVVSGTLSGISMVLVFYFLAKHIIR